MRQVVSHNLLILELEDFTQCLQSSLQQLRFALSLATVKHFPAALEEKHDVVAEAAPYLSQGRNDVEGGFFHVGRAILEVVED